jgi:hypothetical protein
MPSIARWVEPDRLCSPFNYKGHGFVRQSPRLNPLKPIQRPEHRPIDNPCALEPGLQRPDRAGVLRRAVRNTPSPRRDRKAPVRPRRHGSRTRKSTVPRRGHSRTLKVCATPVCIVSVSPRCIGSSAASEEDQRVGWAPPTGQLVLGLTMTPLHNVCATRRRHSALVSQRLPRSTTLPSARPLRRQEQVAGDDQCLRRRLARLRQLLRARGTTALRATDDTVAGNLAELADPGLKGATIARRLWSSLRRTQGSRPAVADDVVTGAA